MTEPFEGMRIGLIGTDARTDAIAAACARSSFRPHLFALAALRVPGLVQRCEAVEVGSPEDLTVVRAWAERVQPDLVIVGPEGPLAAGAVDVLAELGIPAFGPNQEQAQVESSKAWTRDLVARHAIPGNPGYRVFESVDGVAAHLEGQATFVLKPFGLTGGKGVCLYPEHFDSRAAALAYAEELAAGGGLVVEEQLVGEEFSLQTITDGVTSLHCPAAQDHKRAFDGDTGPNTGGMGSYSCADGSMPFLTADDLAQAKHINDLVIAAIGKETGAPYRGLLYGGFMATADGVRLIEYNCRFADPESMNVLPILDGDFVRVAWAVAHGGLADVAVGFEPVASVCKYLVPEGYPTDPVAGGVVTVPEGIEERHGVRVYWAATDLQDGQATLTRSRSLAVVGFAPTLAEAEAATEAAVLEISGPIRHRPDIGTAAVIQRRIDHMAALRGATASA